ncbi:hypothetical protein KY320_01755, partial [Candidatus Woesearchaeota archaeon]|nr:hypothetical protein [Candidatus Woesearchaeota archaeon]
IYVYMAFALQTIAKKTNTENPWLAWIPIANLVLMTQIAGLHWATIFLMLIPFVNIAVIIWWWWKIAEARNKPGWMALLFLVPIANLIVPGILAWSD